jgi:hypothetical protein
MNRIKWVYEIVNTETNRPVHIGESYNPKKRWYDITKKLDLDRETHQLRSIKGFLDRRDAISFEREQKLLWGLPHTEGTRIYHLSKPKPVLVYKGGQLIGEYYAIQEAVRQLKLVKCDVYHVLAGRNKQHKGYTFQYKE